MATSEISVFRVLCNSQADFLRHFNTNNVLLQIHLRLDADGDHAEVSGKYTLLAILRT